MKDTQCNANRKGHLKSNQFVSSNLSTVDGECDVEKVFLAPQVRQSGDDVVPVIVPPEAEQLLRVVRVVAHLGDRFKNRIIVLLTHFQSFSSLNK